MSVISDIAKSTGPSLHYEQSWSDLDCVCGIDEVGRGPLAGPVTAACVYIPPAAAGQDFIRVINDSKKLTAKKREALYPEIKAHCLYGIAQASPEEIDSLNIHHATLLAMRRAYEALHKTFGVKPAGALIDGKFVPDLSARCQAITKGDSISLSIAAASILAKVERDRLMVRLHEEFPVYGWARNAGYGTAEHMTGLKTYGVSPYHRRSFSPVREALGASTK
ncbi:MAG: ribonuclease HII [Rhodospirillales bacterium]|nr:ribonuclease HII [Rhodospirillales bacterium]